jgi:DNA mismatch repair protein PMS2
LIDVAPALKHYTSKLRGYDDLSSLQTFGFRGEALSSLCALSTLHVVTAREDEAPRGTRLDFEASGRLKGTQVVASSRGTTVSVGTIFKTLPVRRQELEKNIKREYDKALRLLQAYACISTAARMQVSNVTGNGKKSIVLATKAGQSTRENIANVFGAKTLSALIPLDLEFEMQGGSSIANAHARNE